MGKTLEEQLAAAKSELKFLRGERKSLLGNLASWESQGHTTLSLAFLHRYLSRKQNS